LITTSIEAAEYHLRLSPYIKRLLKNPRVWNTHFQGIPRSIEGLLSRCSTLTPLDMETIKASATVVARRMGYEHVHIHLNYVSFRAPLDASFTVGCGNASTALLATPRSAGHETAHMYQRADERWPTVMPHSWVQVPNDAVAALLGPARCVDNPDSSVTQYAQYAYVPSPASPIGFIPLYRLDDLERMVIPIDTVTYRAVGRAFPARHLDHCPHLDDWREMEAHMVAPQDNASGRAPRSGAWPR
jgi:hypothetical protein